MFPHSGELSNLGDPLSSACELAVEQINNSGGLLGKDVQLVNADTQSDPQVAVSRMKELLEDEVPAVVGAVSDQVTLKVSEITAKNRVVQISPASTTIDISMAPDKDYLFRTVASNALEGKAQARLARGLGRGLERVSVIHAPDTYGQEVAQSFKENFESNGGKVPVMVTYEEGKDSYQNEVGQALQGEPEFINLIAYPAEGAQMLKEALQKKWARYFFFSHTMKSTQVIQRVGADLLEGLKGTSPASGDGQSERIFIEDFQAKFNTSPQAEYIKNAYDAIATIALAIQKAGRLDGAAIRDSLRKVSNPPGELIFAGEFKKAFDIMDGDGPINYEGASGPIDFDQNGDVNPPFEIWTITDGGFVTEELLRFE